MPLIDLSDAVNVVEGYRDRNPDSWSLCNSIKFDIAELPTISPDEVRGVVKVNYEHGDYSCSACGHPARRLSFALKKYCDECGAKLLWEVSEDA